MSACMKLRVLEEWLQGLDEFEKPKVILEQYATPPHIASCMMHTMQTLYEDIEGMSVCDLGAGCGMLSAGAALLQAGLVTGLEIDPDALDIYSKNMEDLEVSNVNAVLINILDKGSDRLHKKFDTVVMNPPFGTKNNSGMDMEFLKVASQLSSSAVYSLHKTSTRKFIMKNSKELGLEPKVIAELKYNLPSSYKFHKKSSVDIAVDFWRFKVLDTA